MGYTELTEKPHLFEQGLRGDHILGKQCMTPYKTTSCSSFRCALLRLLVGEIPKPLNNFFATCFLQPPFNALIMQQIYNAMKL